MTEQPKPIDDRELQKLLAENAEVLGQARAMLYGSGPKPPAKPSGPDETEKFLADPANRLICRAAAASDGMVNLPSGVSRARLRTLMAQRGA